MSLNIDQIINDKAVLDETLKNALATMEKKDTIRKVRLQLLELQNNCPHYSDKYNFNIVNGICPYCGKKVE